LVVVVDVDCNGRFEVEEDVNDVVIELVLVAEGVLEEDE